MGLFLDNYDLPICYMNFSAIDRDDKWKALCKSLDENINKCEDLENCIRSTFGLEGTPIRISVRQRGDKEL